jgi:hypothetical protein
LLRDDPTDFVIGDPTNSSPFFGISIPFYLELLQFFEDTELVDWKDIAFYPAI